MISSQSWTDLASDMWNLPEDILLNSFKWAPLPKAKPMSLAKDLIYVPLEQTHSKLSMSASNNDNFKSKIVIGLASNLTSTLALANV